MFPQVIHNPEVDAELSNHHEHDDESWENPQDHRKGVAGLVIHVHVIDQDFCFQRTEIHAVLVGDSIFPT